jgi:hypothetical protein
MNDKLFNSILSMDAYNRGYNENIVLTGDLTKLGNANLLIDSSELGTVVVDGQEIDKHELSNFYAIAYERNGQTIISYRGTDDPRATLSASFFGGDIWNGWFAGAGNDDAQQAELAIRFFQAVSDERERDLTTYADTNIILTGHSLGGGLAGHMAGYVAVNDNEFQRKQAV